MPKKKTNDEFINELQLKNPSINPLEPYINSVTKIQCECRICGHKWLATPSHLLHGEGCPVCARNRGALKRKYSQQDFSLKVSRIHPSIVVLGDYTNSKTKILVHCNACENTWNVVPSSLLNGTGCPKCNKRYRRNSADFRAELKQINPRLSVLGDYINAHRKIKVHCNRCGMEWYAEPNSLLKGNDCPSCSHSQTSVVEQIIYYAFINLVGVNEVFNRDIIAIGKELDVYVPSLKMAIEFGAWYWHSIKLEVDIEKEWLCEKEGIHLITIYEGFPKNVEITGLKNAVCYENTISNEKDYITIQELLLTICNKYGLDPSSIIECWEEIIKKAKEDCRKKDAEDFAKELSLKQPSIEYLGEYTGSKNSVYVLCKKCGAKWYASSAYDLLHGHGCPKCSNEQRRLSQRMSTEAFKNQVAEVNPHFEVLEEYKGSTVSIKCRCNKCGNVWFANPGSIRYKKKNCPKCSRVTKKTNDTFIEELKTVSNSIQPLEKYINGRTGIRFKCYKCGYEWTAKPHDVLHGTGCPRCAHRIAITHVEFVERVQKANEQIQIIGEFIDTKTKVKCRCKVCNYEWFGIPSNLMKGAGCRNCAGTIRLQNEEFVKRLDECNPKVEPLEEYVNINTKILCKCTECGHEWKASPNNLFRGHGCPRCKAQKIRLTKSKKILCIETNQIYESIQNAKKETGITSISDCLHNRVKTAGGFHWKYVDD